MVYCLTGVTFLHDKTIDLLAKTDQLSCLFTITCCLLTTAFSAFFY